MTNYLCNGSGVGLATTGELGKPKHEPVRMHEKLAAGAICPICRLEWVPCVGFV